MEATAQQLEELQKKYNDLANAAFAMRKYQRDFFRYRASVDKAKAMEWEKKIDALLAAELKLREEQKSQQQKLF